MNISIVTTFNQEGLDKYAQRMLDSFAKNWPDTITLFAYAENCTPVVTAKNIQVVDMVKTCTKLNAFKERWAGVPKANGDVTDDPIRSKRKDSGKGFKWDAIRFSHKVYAIFDCASKINTDWLVWMDADTYCHSPITYNQIEKFFPKDKDLCFLGREGKYTECGLYGMNMQTNNTFKFLEKFEDMYENAEQGIFTLDEWHDSFVFDAVRKEFNLNELNWSSGIIKGEGHPLINSDWGAYLDHLKGARKDTGKSHAKDLKVRRTESYWTN